MATRTTTKKAELKTSTAKPATEKEAPAKKTVTKKVTADDEWLAEAYMETDYSKLNQDDFQNVLNGYIGYLMSNGRLL